MARQVQLRRGTTAQTSSFTGAIGEVTVDTDKDVVVVHDGSTAGGHPLTKNSTLGTAATTAATDYATAAQGTTADAALPKSGGAMTGAITTNSTFDGVDIATRDAILTSTTTTANAALPKAGGAMTGAITTNSTFDGRDVATDGTKLDGIEASADITDTTNVTAAGALMDSEVTNLAQVKAFDTTDYATAAQGTTADAALPKAGGTMTGALAGTSISASGELIAASYNETYAAVTSTSNATTVNCEAGNTFSHTLTENTTFTFSNPPASGTGYSFTLKVVQDSTARTITWPASVDWAAATAPTISTGSGEVDVFVFFTTDGGTTFYGFTAGQVLS